MKIPMYMDKIFTVLVMLFMARAAVRSDDGLSAYSVSFAVLVQVFDEAGVPIEGASFQQVGIEVANAEKANRKLGMPGGYEHFNLCSYSSILGLATFELIISRETAQEISIASPRTCEIIVDAKGYVAQKLLLSTVQLDYIDTGEGSAGLYTFKLILKKAK